MCTCKPTFAHIDMVDNTISNFPPFLFSFSSLHSEGFLPCGGGGGGMLPVLVLVPWYDPGESSAGARFQSPGAEPPDRGVVNTDMGLEQSKGSNEG